MVPDHCQVCGDFTGATAGSDPDGVVNESDYWYIHDGLGFCTGHPKYTQFHLADLDGDGCITLKDYQSWIMCYRMFNGKVWVEPTVAPHGQLPPTKLPGGTKVPTVTPRPVGAATPG